MFRNVSSTPLGMPSPCIFLLGWSWHKTLVTHPDHTQDHKSRILALPLAGLRGDMAALEKFLAVKEGLNIMEKQWSELCYPAPLLPDQIQSPLFRRPSLTLPPINLLFPEAQTPDAAFATSIQIQPLRFSSCCITAKTKIKRTDCWKQTSLWFWVPFKNSWEPLAHEVLHFQASVKNFTPWLSYNHEHE